MKDITFVDTKMLWETAMQRRFRCDSPSGPELSNQAVT